jgi:diguanylate cyclase (GGDEF)-like protein
MSAFLQRALEGPWSSQWQFFRGSASEILSLLPFVSELPEVPVSGSIRKFILTSPDQSPLLGLISIGHAEDSPLNYGSPTISLAFTESDDAIQHYAHGADLDQAIRVPVNLSASYLIKLLVAAKHSRELDVANRILRAFQWEERQELEYEAWHQHVIGALSALVSAEAIQLRPRAPGDYWESHGECWNWFVNNAVVPLVEIDSHLMSDLFRGGKVHFLTADEIRRQFPVEADRWHGMAFLPLKSRISSLAVMTLFYTRALSPFPDELRSLELLQSEMAHLMDRTRNHLRMQRMATIDELTSLFNHRFFRVQLRTEFRRALRYQKKMALVMIDIDDFKSYNDRYGHLAGDRVLSELGRTIRSTVRDIDFVARYGGEEFALILPEVDSSGGMVVADKVRAAVSSKRFRTESGEDLGAITISCGVTDNINTATPNDLIRRADRALYWAKTHGRNLVRLADPMEEI